VNAAKLMTATMKSLNAGVPISSGRGTYNTPHATDAAPNNVSTATAGKKAREHRAARSRAGIRRLTREDLTLLIKAYYLKCIDTWSELVWATRYKPLPYVVTKR
jgi:hypothetical protein